MKFGSREICDVVLRAKATQKLGSRTFYKNEPVLYFDTLRTSTMEGAATTVYAQGGRGHGRLIAWEGEKTLTFTMEDALLSPEGLSILTGANLIDAGDSTPIYVHTTAQVEVGASNKIVIDDIVCWNGAATNSVEAAPEGVTAADYKHDSADIFYFVLDENGEFNSEPNVPSAVEYAKVTLEDTSTKNVTNITLCGTVEKGKIVFVDYYVKKIKGAQQIEITQDKFAGYYYLEASTLFRKEANGVDMPAEFVIPKGKIQSNFSFAMASSGDPSVFTWTMDAFPDYTKFDKTRKVLAVIQIIDEESVEDNKSRECLGE